ncbi:MAG: transposase [Alphaproteobacteria bacterium]|nr:transposase [Alphaproteobacteria bacterium]
MFTLRDRRTGDLFDRWSDLGEKRRRLLERSWAGVFRKHLLENLPVDELSHHLDDRLGRPSKDLHVVIGVLILQQLHDLSDRATVEALAFNMAWHYALGVQSEADAYFCEKTLRNYRRLFIAQGLDELLFQRLTDRLVRAFDVDTSRQRMDSTALRSAMRSLTRLGIVVETISKFVRELKRSDPALHSRIDADMIRRYVDCEGDGAFANTSPSVSRRRLLEAGQDLLALALQFRGTAAEQLSSFAILERVLRDQFDVVEDGSGKLATPIAIVRKPADVPCDTVGNPADPDSSFNAHKGQGYMAQIVETWCDDDPDGKGNDTANVSSPDLITHVEVHKMTVHDGHRVEDAMAGLETRNLKPAMLLGDSHYGAGETKAMMRTREIDLVAPMPPAKGALSGRLTLEDFALDASGLVLRCPNDIKPTSTSASRVRLQARFDLSDCRRCPDMLRCPVQADKYDGSFARFQYTPVRVANRKRRLYEQSKAFLDIYRWRAGIEATMSRLKHQMNLANLRVRGMPAMRYVVHLRALGLNIHRCARVGQGI